MEIKKNKLLKKLKGYQKAPRARILLLTQKRLTQEEFLLYELVIAITDWDPKHEDYGTFEATNREIAEILGWKSDTTALKHKKKLIEKRIIESVGENRFSAKGFEKWQLRKANSSENQDLTVKSQAKPAEIKEIAVKNEENYVQRDNYSLVSSKVDLSSLNGLVDETLSDEELDRIISDIDNSAGVLK